MKYTLLITITLILLGSGNSCSKKNPLPPPSPLPVKITQEADRMFESGDLADAFGAYEEVLNHPDLTHAERDQVRFRLGLILADPLGEKYDPDKAIQFLTQTANSNAVATESNLLISILNEHKKTRGSLADQKKETARIKEELEKLKAVDKERRRSRNP